MPTRKQLCERRPANVPRRRLLRVRCIVSEADHYFKCKLHVFTQDNNDYAVKPFVRKLPATSYSKLFREQCQFLVLNQFPRQSYVMLLPEQSQLLGLTQFQVPFCSVHRKGLLRTFYNVRKPLMPCGADQILKDPMRDLRPDELCSSAYRLPAEVLLDGYTIMPLARYFTTVSLCTARCFPARRQRM
jgi:hypothetical protein